MSKPRILLSGGSGFIGGNILASAFLGQRYDLVAPNRTELDLLDSAAVDAYFSVQRFDAVIHAAGKPGHRNAKDPTALFYSNTRQFFNLARHAGKVDRLIVLGSGAAYGQEHYRPRMAEDYFGVHVPVDEHGFCKYVCGQHIERSDNIVDLRLFGVFGPGEDTSIRFISNLMCKCLVGLPLTMNRDRRFDYLHVDDLMPVLDHFLKARPSHRAYNVTPDETVSLLDLAERIRALSGKDLPIEVAEPGQGPEYSGDNARLKAEFTGFSPRPLASTLPALYRWYEARQSLIRREDLLRDR